MSLFAKQKNGLKIDLEKNTGTWNTGLPFIDSHATIKRSKRLRAHRQLFTKFRFYKLLRNPKTTFQAPTEPVKALRVESAAQTLQHMD